MPGTPERSNAHFSALIPSAIRQSLDSVHYADHMDSREVLHEGVIRKVGVQTLRDVVLAARDGAVQHSRANSHERTSLISSTANGDASDRSSSSSPSLARSGSCSSGTVTTTTAASVHERRSGNKRKMFTNEVEELVKDDAYWQRRKKNNDAAKRSRDTRKIKEDEVAVRAASLERENAQLRIQMENLRTETEQLRGLFVSASQALLASLSLPASALSQSHSDLPKTSFGSLPPSAHLPEGIRVPIPIRPMPIQMPTNSVITRNSVLMSSVMI